MTDHTPSPASIQAVIDAGQVFRDAQAARDEARAALRSAVRAGYRDGITEVAMATYAGVNRMTIRDWLGKDPFRHRRKTAKPAADAAD
jgi:hypothetical protein